MQNGGEKKNPVLNDVRPNVLVLQLRLDEREEKEVAG
jgi:hypothetical protein